MPKTAKHTLAERARRVADTLTELYPDAACSLAFGGDAWRLFVMGRLSAQCTDERVNIVCRTLFSEIPDVFAMAEAPLSQIEELVRPCGLYHTKAQNLKDSAAILVRDYGGAIPGTMEELLALPGVGRKIANLLLGDIFHRGGIVADTHCIRICGRLGFYPETVKDPLKTERIMNGYIPEAERSDFCHRIVHFGREYCMARSPECAECPMRSFCEHGRKALANP